MKIATTVVAITVFATGVLFTACGSPEKKVDKANEKVEDAREDLSDAKQDLADAKQDTVGEYAKYKAEWMIKISKNDIRIADYRKEIVSIKDKQVRDNAKKRADELEKKNNDMKTKLEKTQKDSNWDNFKREFENDMDGLAESISDLFKNNKK